MLEASPEKVYQGLQIGNLLAKASLLFDLLLSFELRGA